MLNQKKAKECEDFLKNTNDNLIFLSEFTLYSIGIICTKLKKNVVFEKFIEHTFKIGNAKLVSLEIEVMKTLLKNIDSYSLDFDDAYQLTCSLKHNLILVSFDTDFDRSPIKRKEPANLLP